MFDLINGCLEIGGAIFQAFNVRQLIKDKQVKGVSWPATAFFTAWGLWNLIYYPHLGQWFSTIGGVALVVTNLTWLGLLYRYNRRQRNDRAEELVRLGRAWVDTRANRIRVERYVQSPTERAQCSCTDDPDI
jgi:hypothetical protein